SNRAQERDLVLDSWRSSVYVAFAIRQSVLDRNSQRGDWPDSGVGIFGDCGLRAGAGSGQSGNDLRALLWVRLWNGGTWRGCSWLAGGFDQHQFRVSGVFVSSSSGFVGGVLAEYRAAQAADDP